MSRARRVTAAIVGAFLAFGAPLAHAETDADVATARDLFHEGYALTQKGDWEGARHKFAESLRRKRAATTMYSLAVAEKSTGHFVDAVEHFRAFLAEPPAPSTEPYEQPARDALAELEGRVGRVVVTLAPAPPDARVTLDGVEIPSEAIGHPRLVAPGAHEVAASAKGYVTDHRATTVAAGDVATVALTLERAVVEAPASPAPAPTPRAPSPPSRPSRALPITMMAGGGALLVGGLALGFVGVKQAAGAPTRDGAQASAAKAKGLAGDVLGGVGIASAAIGVVLYAVGKPTTRDAAWKVEPWSAGKVIGVRVVH